MCAGTDCLECQLFTRATFSYCQEFAVQNHFILKKKKKPKTTFYGHSSPKTEANLMKWDGLKKEKIYGQCQVEAGNKMGCWPYNLKSNLF